MKELPLDTVVKLSVFRKPTDVFFGNEYAREITRIRMDFAKEIVGYICRTDKSIFVPVVSRKKIEFRHIKLRESEMQTVFTCLCMGE